MGAEVADWPHPNWTGLGGANPIRSIMKRDTKQRRNEGKLMTQNRAELNRNLAQMLKGGVIIDVTTPHTPKNPTHAGE